MPPTPGFHHELPLPVAALVRYAGNAKAAKDRHDAAHRAWEASIQLAVAARPPADVSTFLRGSLGHWVGALSFASGTPESLDSPELLAAFALFAEVGTDRKLTPSKIATRALFEPLPAYRNAVIGHGGIRAPEFYDRAATLLREGLVAAWSVGLFLPAEAHLVYAESVEIDSTGARRARLYDLAGLASHVVDPTGTRGIPDDLLPRRVYVLDRGHYRTLHPLVLYHEQEQKERVLFFNGYGRKADFLDYAGGEKLKEVDRRESFPTLDEEVRAYFGGTRISEDKTPSEPAATDPNRFGDYEILGKLGEGGMGIVYLARQIPIRRIVALKMLPAEMARDPVRVARFRREITALGKCDHPNVVKIFASGETNGTPYFAMEYVDGPDLKAVATALSSSDGDFHTAVSSASDAVKKERETLFANVPDLSRRSPSEPSLGHAKAKDRYRQLARAFRDAARGVQELHDQGIVHRDLKPENLMVTAAEHRVVVMDLGLARVKDASLSITQDKNAVLGTLRYMPPEQLLRSLFQVDHRADVYSLGATLYELIANRPLFDGDSEERLRHQIIRERPQPLRKLVPDVPRDLATIVEKAVEKDPNGRYATAADLATDLAAYLDDRPIAAREHGPFYPLKLWARQNKGLATTIAGSTLLVLAVAVVAFILVSDARIRADENATEAKLQETIAKENEIKAEAAAAEARRERDQVLHLSDVQRLKDLDFEAASLWPAHPEKIAGIEDWLVRARELAGRLPAHRDRRAELREKALPWDAEQQRLDRETHPEAPRLRELLEERTKATEALAKKLEAKNADHEADGATTADEIRESIEKTSAEISRLKGEVAVQRTWKFETKDEEWQHGLIAGLVDGIERLTRDDRIWTAVTIAALERRLEFAKSVRQKTIDDVRAKWDFAITGIQASEKYGGREIVPQMGLVPIGQDPESGLFEFWHVQSGDKPKHDKSGRIAPSAEMGIVLVLIPGGTFSMGSPESEWALGRQDDEGPVQDVTLDPFFIAKYEMTQGQWERFAGRNPSQIKPPEKYGNHAITLSNPVEQVSWEDCFQLLMNLGLELPTEAQWEFAARAGTDGPWWTGPDRQSLFGKANTADKAAQDDGESWIQIEPDLDDGHTVHAPVGSFAANAFGLHEVAGNVWEWCRDWYGSYRLPVNAQDGERQVPASERETRVGRGGSFLHTAASARSAIRYYDTPEFRYGLLGVRPARRVTSD